MDKNQIEQLVRQILEEDKQKAQYGVNRTSVHTHNGQDSPRLDFGVLNNRQFFVTSHVFGTSAATSGNYGHFFMNPLNFDTLNNVVNNTTAPMYVMEITEIHGRAGNDAGTVSLFVSVLNPGDASLTGGTHITSAINLKGTADTFTYIASAPGTNNPIAVLYPGQRLALQTSGTLTNVADVLVTVLLQY